jgi:PleD family two-component response regulator
MEFNILSVDECGITGVEFASMLKELDINFIDVSKEKEAINVLRDNAYRIDAVLWTINSENDKCFEAVRRVKDVSICKQIPFVIISECTNKNFIIKAIEAGAVEYIVKPYDEETIIRKMHRLLGVPYDDSFNNNTYNDDIVSFNFSEMFSREIKAASRGGYHLTLMAASIVPEESIYDSEEDVYEIIRLVKNVIKIRLRETDTLFHYNKNGLLLILPFADKEGAKSVEERIRETFGNHSLIKQKTYGYKLITTSVTFPEDGRIRKNLMNKLETGYSRLMGTADG